MNRSAASDPVALEFAQRFRKDLGLRVREIVLFGSRARGDSRADSDYDVLVVVSDEQLTTRERLSLQKRGRLLFLSLGHPADVLVRTHAEKERQAGKWFTVTGAALAEGVPL